VIGGEPVIVMVAPSGARKGRADHAALPLTPAELAATAMACKAAGAALFHLHVRTPAGRHSLSVDHYRAAIDAIRAAAGDDLDVQATTEAAGIFTPAEQMTLVRALRPEAVSLAIRELVPNARAEPEAGAFFAWLEDAGIAPQYILYTPDDVDLYRELCGRGVIGGLQPSVLFVLGRYAVNQTSSPVDLLPFLQAWGDRSEPWAVCAFGPREGACGLAAAALGGHVRVGFENNLQLVDGSIAADNAALVRQIVQGLALVGRPIADAATARRILFRRSEPSRSGS